MLVLSILFSQLIQLTNIQLLFSQFLEGHELNGIVESAHLQLQDFVEHSFFMNEKVTHFLDDIA